MPSRGVEVSILPSSLCARQSVGVYYAMENYCDLWEDVSMPNRSSMDVNEIAFLVVAESTGEKNPNAVALGRLGGLKGGPARAQGMTARKRKAQAKKAADARWSKKHV